MRDKKRA